MKGADRIGARGSWDETKSTITFDLVRDLLAEETGTPSERITADTPLYDLADSLDLELSVLAVADSLGCHIRENDGMRVRTVGDLANYFAGGCIIVETLPVPSSARQPDLASLPIPRLPSAPE
ncbi:MAG TPA: acyl carrier protein [Armatimonadota bacterium]|nr:acyl carrier protein [Armatimonadota bacterium]